MREISNRTISCFRHQTYWPITKAIFTSGRTAAARVRLRAKHVEFVVDKVALGQVSPANHHSTNFFILIITRGWHNRSIGGRSAEGTQLDSTPHYSNLKKITSGWN
jgi:hypothetical protein